MRVIAGSLGGRIFQAPKGNRTHPMGDRVKGGLFNALGDISGLTILDAFSGSGALAIEAVSRGSLRVTALEPDRHAGRVIELNVKSLGIEDKVKVTKATAGSWSDTNTDRRFDIVLCDPPYDDLQLSTIQKLARHLEAGGLMVVSWPGKLEPAEFTGLKPVKQLSYGDAQLVFYQKIR